MKKSQRLFTKYVLRKPRISKESPLVHSTFFSRSMFSDSEWTSHLYRSMFFQSFDIFRFLETSHLYRSMFFSRSIFSDSEPSVYFSVLVFHMVKNLFQTSHLNRSMFFQSFDFLRFWGPFTSTVLFCFFFSRSTFFDFSQPLLRTYFVNRS